MENAFAEGYSTPEKVALNRHADNTWDEDDVGWMERDEQGIMDKIISGENQGHYWLVTGEKGTGKTSLIFKSLKDIDGEGCAMLEVHGDLEIFRLRLGKALDYEFHEDYIGGLFSFKGPRDSTPLLDIERAFNKMEKIALKRRQEKEKPLVLILNGVHLLRDDADGRNLLELIQQRAELWAASKLVTVVFNSNDYWITERLMLSATRLNVLPIHDVSRNAASVGLRRVRKQMFGEEISDDLINQVYSKVGGRLRFLNQVMRAPNMLDACHQICEQEKRWLLNHCWILGADMDDNAEDHQDFCSAAIILAKEMVERQDAMRAAGSPDWTLPSIPLHEVRVIHTRPDFIQQHDHINVFAIDQYSMVQADSVAMQNAFREICSQPGFEEHLKATMDRLDELESLGRTREIKMKESKHSTHIYV